MLEFSPKKAGFTLIEVLVVVAIIGVLSTMGVVSLKNAVQNTRIKDAGINVTAYMERTANEANRLSSKLCVKVENGNLTLRTYKGDCTGELGEAIDEMSLEPPSAFVAGTCMDHLINMVTAGGAPFVPRLGLSAAPTGCIMIRYGSTDHYAVVMKTATKNSVTYKLSYDGANGPWFDF